MKRLSRRALVAALVVTRLSAAALSSTGCSARASAAACARSASASARSGSSSASRCWRRGSSARSHRSSARPARLGGAAGRLARENAIRNPARTAATAAALMIGLTLVTFVAVFGRGAPLASDEKAIARPARARLRRHLAERRGRTFPVGPAAAGVRSPGVALVSASGSDRAKLRQAARSTSAASTRRRSPTATASSGRRARMPRWPALGSDGAVVRERARRGRRPRRRLDRCAT